MRIGILTTSYPRFDGDAAGSFVRALCVALVRMGHTCEVLAPSDPDARVLRDQEITIHRVPSRAPGAPPLFYAAGVPDNVRSDPRALAAAAVFLPSLAIAASHRAVRWDAVLSHWAVPSALVSRAIFGARRHVAVWHSADVQLAVKLLGPRAWRTVRGAANAHAFVAEHLRVRLGAEGDPRAHVVPMGIDLPRAIERPGLRGRALRALVVARLVPIKRVELAIRAAEEAGAELVIAGEGPERPRLEKLAQRATTRFVGAVDETARTRLFSECDVLLATSAHDARGATEGYPVAPREALAHGMVVVATDDPVHRELARRCGEPVLLSAEDALGQTLGALARDPERLTALSALAPARVAGDAWPRVAARIAALLDAPTDLPAERAASELDAASARVR